VATNRDSGRGDAKPTRTGRQLVLSLGFMLTSLLAIWLFQQFVVSTMLAPAREIPYSEFRDKLKTGQLVEITIGSPRITGVMKNPAATSEQDKTIPVNTVAPPIGDPKLLDELDTVGVKYRVRPPASPVGEFVLFWLLPLLLLGTFWFSAYRRAGSVGGGVWASGRARPPRSKLARLASPTRTSAALTRPLPSCRKSFSS
jgi:cell division protease FtsH